MELINGVSVFLLLALSSLFSSANAICVPRNYDDFESPVFRLHLQHAPSHKSQSESESKSQSKSKSKSPPPAPRNSAPKASVTAPKDSVSDKAPNSKKKHSDKVSSEASSSGTAPTNLVEICDVTSNPQLCTTSISSNIEGSEVDPTSALKAEIEESIEQVEKAVATVKELRKDTAASKAEIAVYDTCLENFDMAIFDLKSGLESIDAKDSGRMESVLTAVLSDLTTCEDTFLEMGVDSPLDNLSSKMDKFASNCLALSKLLL